MYALALIKHAFMHPQTALHNLGVIAVVKLQRLSESKECSSRQFPASACSELVDHHGWQGQQELSAYGTDDPHPGFARDVGHNV